MHIVENPLGVRLGTAVSYTGTTTTFTVRKDPSMPSVCHRQWRVAAVAVCLAMLAGCTDAPTPSISPSTSSRVQGESIEGGPAYVLRQNDRLLLRSVCAGGFTEASVAVVAGHNAMVEWQARLVDAATPATELALYAGQLTGYRVTDRRPTGMNTDTLTLYYSVTSQSSHGWKLTGDINGLPEGTVLWSGGTEPLSDFEASGHGSTQPCV